MEQNNKELEKRMNSQEFNRALEEGKSKEGKSVNSGRRIKIIDYLLHVVSAK